MLNTPTGNETPFNIKLTEDPWDTQSTKSFYTATTPTPKTPVKPSLPSGSDVFQAVLQEMYDEIKQEKSAKAEAEKKLKQGRRGRRLSRIPTRVSLKAPSVLKASVFGNKTKSDNEKETKMCPCRKKYKNAQESRK